MAHRHSPAGCAPAYKHRQACSDIERFVKSKERMKSAEAVKKKKKERKNEKSVVWR